MNLNRDIPYYVALLEVLRRKSADILFESDQSILLLDRDSQVYMLACENNYEIDLILPLIKDKTLTLVHGEIGKHKIKDLYDLNPDLTSYNSVYLEKEPLCIPDHEVEIKYLDESFVPVVQTHYSVKDLCDEEHIRERIQDGMLGAFIHNEICGFIGRHEEGAMGMLEVFPSYRHMGIAQILQFSMANEQLKKNAFVYGQVMDYNHASMKLQKKVGFTLCDKPVYWYFSLHSK